VHLETDSFGSGPAGDALRERVRRSFSGVIEIANERHVDMLLIVGDLFDSSRISEGALGFALAEIARAAMPVVMIPGNHDAHDERSLYANLGRELLPRNLHLILDPEGTLIDLPELETRIWGRALVEHTPEYRPLGGVPAPAPGRWNIAMAHGFFTEESDGFRSSPITPAEIEASAYDYVALGHIPQTLLVRGHSLQPSERRDHPEQQRELRHLRQSRLPVHDGPLWIDPGREQIQHEALDERGELVDPVVVRRQHVPVGHEVEALVPLVLQADRVADVPRPVSDV